MPEVVVKPDWMIFVVPTSIVLVTYLAGQWLRSRGQRSGGKASASDVLELSREARRQARRSWARKEASVDGESYTRTVRAILNMFDYGAYMRCEREGAYALLDGMRFIVQQNAGKADDLMVQVRPADWQANWRRWDYRSFVVLANRGTLAAVIVEKPKLDPIPAVVDEEVI